MTQFYKNGVFQENIEVGQSNKILLSILWLIVEKRAIKRSICE